MNYQIADFIIRIKNAALANRKEVHMPYTNVVLAIGKVLVKEGFLSDIKEDTEADSKKRTLVATVRYVRRKPVVHDVTVISKPSLRIYKPTHEVGRNKDRAVTTIFSTSSGVMTGRDAVKKGVGGELLFAIW